MIVEPLPVNLLLPRNRAPRTPGIHVSSVIRLLAVRKGHLKIGMTGNLSLMEEVDQEAWWNRLAPIDRLRMSIGLAWEEWYIREQLPEVVDHPGEMELDNIYMTDDGESLDTVIIEGGTRYKLRVHEVKATSKSIHELKNEWMWMTQVKCYCKGAQSLDADLHALYIHGNYKYPIQPQIRRWRLTFSQDEIDATWDEILQTVRDYHEDRT